MQKTPKNATCGGDQNTKVKQDSDCSNLLSLLLWNYIRQLCRLLDSRCFHWIWASVNLQGITILQESLFPQAHPLPKISRNKAFCREVFLEISVGKSQTLRLEELQNQGLPHNLPWPTLYRYHLCILATPV